mgnify:FL=1
MQKYHMLIADDSELKRALLHKIFSSEYILAEPSNRADAMNSIVRHATSLDVVLLDIHMPKADGFEVLCAMAQDRLLDDVPVVIITAYGNLENEERCLDMGASDIINKPFNAGTVTRRVRNVVLARQHRDQLRNTALRLENRLQRSFASIVDTLSAIIEYRNLESGQHILRTKLYTKILLSKVAMENPGYGLSDETIAIISSAAALHDVGKIVIPDAILNKPGPLTESEFAIMKRHATEGSSIVRHLDLDHHEAYLRYAQEIALSHHERWDGKGYPNGLAGDAIPIWAQVTGIVDVYDALTTKRVYKPAYSHKKSVEMILNGECGVFSEELLRCFVKVLPDFESLSRRFADGARNLPQVSLPLPGTPVFEAEPRSGRSLFDEALEVGSTVFFSAELPTGLLCCCRKDSRGFSENFPLSFAQLHEAAVTKVHPDDLYNFKQQTMLLENGIEWKPLSFRWRISGDRYRVIREEFRICTASGGKQYALGLLSAEKT